MTTRTGPPRREHTPTTYNQCHIACTHQGVPAATLTELYGPDDGPYAAYANHWVRVGGIHPTRRPPQHRP